MRTGRMLWWLALSTLIAAAIVTPALANDEDGKSWGRWNPTGTYLMIDEEGACFTPGTVFLSHISPADRLGRTYQLEMTRVNNLIGGGISDFKTIRGELYRSGRDSFNVTSLLYTTDENSDIVYIFLNTGTMVRNGDGEVWVELSWYYYWPWQNPLDPDEVPFFSEGPCALQVDSKLGYVPPPTQ